MAVKTKLQLDYDADAIVALAGYAPADAWVQDGWLYIEGPTQNEINQAKAAYISDHATNHLARQKRLANDEVDVAAEEARGRLLRTTPGQSIVEFKREKDAERYIADGYPASLNGYPWIKSEVEITGFTGQKVADAIIVQRDADLVTDALVEKERKNAKNEIDNQLGPIGVHVARDNLKAILDQVDPITDVSNLPRSTMPQPEEIVSREVFISPPVEEFVQIEEPDGLKEEPVEERGISDMVDNYVSTFEPPELTFDEIVEEALYTVEAMVENARQVYLGVGPAQMMVYAEKFNEASDYIVDDMPEDVSRYPFINAEVGATGESAEEVANSIIDMKGEWITFNANAERIRMVAKTHILESKNESSVDQIVRLTSEQLDKMLD